MGAHPEYGSGEVIANKYVVEGPLGDSPLGRSYLASAGMGSPKLVVKILRPELSARLTSAPDFFLKAGVAAEVEHDNLAVCLDVQEEMGNVFTARLHAEGTDFEAWARKSRREGNHFTRGLEILWQACQGLAALHERSRHLNIHPGNLLVTPLMAKLADWDPRFLGSMEMTPEPLPFRPEYAGYRAPEMATRGAFLSYPSTDLYAVGGLLYRLVVGEHPSRDAGANQAAIGNLDSDLSRFLSRAMHPRPEDRFQEAATFSDALWELQGAMARLQESAPRAASPRAAEPAAKAPPPTVAMPPPWEASPRGKAPAESTTEPTLFGSAPVPPARPAIPRDDASLFGEPAPRPPARPPKPPPPPPKPAGNDTFFGSSLESAPTGETLFGSPPPVPPRGGRNAPPPRPQPPGLSGLEGPGTLFGSEPEPPPARRAPSRPEPPQQAPLSLASLEKDPLDLEREEKQGGFTQFGFKGAGEGRTLYGETQKMPAQKKLYIALGVVGALVLILGLGGLFVYLRSTAAPTVTDSHEELADDPPPPESAPLPVPAPAEPAAPPPAAEQPPYPEVAEAPPPRPGPPAPAARPEPAAPSPAAAPSAPSGGAAPKGSPERLSQLMRMVETRNWPASPGERLGAADELNDFGKVAEANVVYGRALQAPGISEKQKVSALGGLAATFQSMGMKDQALDAVEQILAINPRNGFALKLRERLKSP